MQYETILKNGFAWRRDKQVWTYIIAIMAVSFAGLFTTVYFADDFVKKVFDSGININSIASIGVSLLDLVLIVLLVSLVVVFIQAFIQTLILKRGMEHYKIKTMSFGLTEYINLIVLGVFSFILALTSYYEKKFFYAFIAIVVLNLIAFFLLFVDPTIGIILFLILVLAEIIYSLIVIYNMIRLSMAPMIFLEKQGVVSSLKESWNITNGKVLDIFIAFVLLIILVWIVSYITNAFGEMLVYGIFPELNFSFQNASQLLQYLLFMMQNLGTYLLVLLSPLIIIGALLDGFIKYYSAGIYSQVKGNKPSS